MRTSVLIASCALTAALAAGTAWAALRQEAMPGMPAPGPHQQLLQRLEGVWKADCSMMGMSFQGTETNRMVGPFWVTTDFESEMMGQPFHGHGVTGWSDDRKAYVSTWVSSMDTYLELAEGQWDAEAQQLVMTGKSKGMMGGEVDQKTVSTWKDDDHYTVEITHDGQPFLTIEYERAE